MAEKFRVMIVDDERLARQDLTRRLSKHTEVEIVAEASSVSQAVEKIPEVKPDVVFLDIQMPNESGLNLFNRIDVDFKVVFVTAFDNYAIRAFELNALDYLLKPVTEARLAQTIARLSEPGRNLTGLKEKLNNDDYLFINSLGKSGFIRVDSILCIKAMGDFCEVYTVTGEKNVVLRSMREWEEHLPPKSFLRIHRGIIINVSFVEKVEPWTNSTFQIHMKHLSVPFQASRKYSRELRNKFF